MKSPGNLAIVLVALGLIVIAIGFLNQIDYATAGTPVAHLRAMKIIGVGFLLVIVACWFAGRAFPTAKSGSIFVLVMAVVSTAFYFAALA